MKRVSAVLITVSMMAAVLAGCSNSGETYLSSIDEEKYVTSLGEYKGIEISAAKTEVTDEYVDSYIDYLLMQYPVSEEITGRAVESGDTVNIDYVGKDMDGAAFDGGTAQGYNLTIGSGSFIDGFEDGLIGANIGDTVELNLTFPENYHSADMAGKEVIFTVTVNSISTSRPAELNDEFAAQFGNTDVEDFRNSVTASLEENAEATYEAELQQQVIDSILETSEFSDELPEGLYNYYKEQIAATFQSYASAYGVDEQTFVTQYSGLTEEEYNEQIETSAVSFTKQALICGLIAEKEGITVTDDELNAEIEANYANFGYESADAYREAEGESELRDYLLTGKVFDFLVENAVITEAAADTAADAAEEEASE